MSINIPRPPPYKRKIWDYNSAEITHICDEILKVNWQELFFNLNASEMCLLFTDVFLRIMTKHISNKIITCDDKDAPWITPQVKSDIKRNSGVYRKRVDRGRNPHDRDHVRKVQNDTNKLIKDAKLSYYFNLGNQLSDPSTGQKKFWTAYKKLANQKRNRNIPPIVIGGVYVSNFKQKAGIFNFANQCTINDNGSVCYRVFS